LIISFIARKKCLETFRPSLAGRPSLADKPGTRGEFGNFTLYIKAFLRYNIKINKQKCLKK